MKLSFIILVLIISNTLLSADFKGGFFSAVHSGNINLVEEYIKMGINVNIQDDMKRTALMIAMYKNDMKIAKLLIDNDANVNIQDNKFNSPFLYACEKGYINILKIMYKNADTKNSVNIYGANALILACENGHLETTKLLLENTDINVNHIDNLSRTALLEITIFGKDTINYVEIVKLLLQYGADKNIKDNKGHDALYYAKERNLKNIEKLLLNQDINNINEL
ncbi:ankyrin repeat domain-containing protein [uncultured Brachyspira sp.]|uniref:ankyrin repeat domain-containing protein n=1 Tax=uncultured Brachyspira sp. TaxID=221953 RepID=UPI0026169ABD|nr:ankyrin repeat domain-containing protein [uncultured Brachyspira sp.]